MKITLFKLESTDHYITVIVQNPNVESMQRGILR